MQTTPVSVAEAHEHGHTSSKTDGSPPSAPKRGVPPLDMLFPVGWFVLFVLALYTTVVWFSFGELGARGQFGDMFGGANALISATTLVGLAYTIFLQRIELNRTSEGMAEQSASIYRQQFDATFFQLLNVQAGILSDVSVTTSGGGLVRGRAAFSYAKLRLEFIYPHYRSLGMKRDDAAPEAYDDLDVETGGVLGHYFRNLYHIIKFADESRLLPDEKKRYTSFVRAQLSEAETVALFFNCTTLRADKFQPLIEKYALLEHLPEWKFDGEDLRVYNEPAYGTNDKLLTKYRYF